MHYIYHITYSCYDQAMTILLNDKRISNSSSLLQYMGEPFECWCEVLPEILAREVGEDFTFIYTGRPEEAEILEHQCQQIRSCIGFKYKEPILQDTLQMRMKKLNKLISDYRLPVNRRVISVTFLGKEETLRKYGDDISCLEIENRFCKVDVHTLEYWNKNQLRKEEFPVYLAETIDDALLMAEDTDAFKYAVFLGKGNRDAFCKVKGNRFVYSFTDDTLINQIFRSLLLFPLLECFNECVLSVGKQTADKSIQYKLLVLKAIKPLVQVRAEERIESGSTVPLQMRTLPPNVPRPELEFQYQIPGIVQCSSDKIKGLKAGRTEVKVYEKGSIEAIRTLNFEVYQRNRITDIVFQEKQMVCGIGDSFSLDWEFYPEDADNTNMIQWKSSNPKAARVDEMGRIHIVGAGRCSIICSAETVSEVCELDCRPYLQQIILPEDIQGEISMQTGEQRELLCTLNPPDAIDGELIISSSDLLTVNVVGNELEAIADGTAMITVENISHSIRHDFRVNVGKYAKKKKSIFGLFK